MRRLSLFIALLPAYLAADGGNPCPEAYAAEEETGAGGSVIAFWLPDSILAERVRFIRKP